MKNLVKAITFLLLAFTFLVLVIYTNKNGVEINAAVPVLLLLPFYGFSLLAFVYFLRVLGEICRCPSRKSLENKIQREGEEP